MALQNYLERLVMEFVLICGIVGIALLLAVLRIVRTLREPAPPCCNCDSCTQPESVKGACAGMQKVDSQDSTNHPIETDS